MPKSRASSTQRIALCPGSERASWACPESTSDEASRGNRIHEALAFDFLGKTREALVDEEETVVQDFKAMIEPFIPAGEYELLVEAHFESRGWSGHIDLGFVPADPSQPIFINDWKSGWGDVPDPDVNGQVRAYACLVSDKYPGREVLATLTTPRGVQKPVLYTASGLETAWAELKEIQRRAFDPSESLVRHPGTEQCKYCRAFGRPTCPETCKSIEVIPPRVPALNELSPMDLGKLYHQGKLAEKLVGLVKEEVIRRIEAGVDVPGCYMTKESTRTTITDNQAAFNAMAAIPQEKFLTCCTISIPKLSDQYSLAAGCSKAAARRAVESLLEQAGAITQTTTKGSLRTG